MLRVDYTDKRPIQSAQFPSNWELSSARAIAVVQYLISKGVQPAHPSPGLLANSAARRRRQRGTIAPQPPHRTEADGKVRPELSHRALRPPRDDERQALVELWIAAWKATYPDIDFDARRDWFVAEPPPAQDDLRLRRRAADGIQVIDPATGWLDQIAVRPKSLPESLTSCRRRRQARLAGTHPLDVNADNFRALRFAKGKGFSASAPEPTNCPGETAKLE